MLSGKEYPRNGNQDLRSLSNTHPTNDGYIYIAPLTSKMWEDFCKIMGKNDWSKSDSPYFTSDGRLEHRVFLEENISEWTIQFSKKEVFEMLQEVGIASGPVNTLEDIANDPHIKERNMLRKMKVGNGEEVFVNGVPLKVKEDELTEFTSPPSIGEHSRDILKELGYSSIEINRFIEKDVISSQ
jgi:CoA:oxalate CoA-transferase